MHQFVPEQRPPSRHLWLELARREDRDYELASQLLQRIRGTELKDMMTVNE